MEGSNQQVQAPAQQAPQKPKTWTERFSDMEVAIARMSYVVNFHTNAMGDMMSQMEGFLTTQNTIRNSINAILELQAEGLPATLDNVTKKIVEQQNKLHKEQLQKDLADGVLVASEAIKDGNTIVAFESLPEVEYGHGVVASFPDETRSLLVGKKAGDIVNNIKILGVYEGAPQKEATDDQNKEEKADSKTES